MDPTKMAAEAAKSSGFGVGSFAMGQGSSLDAGASSSLKGGDVSLTGSTFGNYTAAPKTNWAAWLVGGAVVLGAVFILKGKA